MATAIEQLSVMLTPKRLRDQNKQYNANRTDYDSDISRIITSAPFRRLQDKTQVFPMEECDFVRTRLTHSLEVANFAKGLGSEVEELLFEKNKDMDVYRGHYISKILEAAGLVHDIGNPPFGHFGEKSISEYFKKIEYVLTLSKKAAMHKGVFCIISPLLSLFRKEETAQVESELRNNNVAKAFKNLSEQQRLDFIRFDGNVHGFRVLRRLCPSADGYSYNLTKAVLCTIVKYPYPSTHEKSKDSKNHIEEKYGYYQSEQKCFCNLWKEYGLEEGQRFPLTFLLEAADDIANLTSDIEDAYRMGILSYDEIKEQMKGFKEINLDLDVIEAECKEHGQEWLKSNLNVKSKQDLVIQKFRINTAIYYIKQCAQIFTKNLQGILQGLYHNELVKDSSLTSLTRALKGLQSKAFLSRGVLTKELQGERAITALLDLFLNAVFDENLIKDDKINAKEKSGKAYNLISENYKVVASPDGKLLPDDDYAKFLLVVDYIAGMTDSYAMKLYHELCVD